MKLQLAVLLIILGFTTPSEVDDTNEDTSVNEIDVSDVDNISTRIFGGSTAPRDKYLYVARLSIRYSSGMRAGCSGVVLTTKIILTVAHCVIRPGDEKAISVIATLPRGGFYIFRQDEIFINPSYNGMYGADVAILKKDTTLATFMRNFGTVPSVPVQNANPIVTSTNAIIAGWGRTSSNRFYSRRLQFANALIMDAASCTSLYGDIEDSMFANELICTFTNVAGICEGDWGGPLLVQEGNREVLRGMHMFRRGECSNSNPLPSAYYNVELAGNWLRTFPELSNIT